MSQETKITLPEDEPAHLYVLSMAALSMMYKMFTKTVYELEVKTQEVNSLSNLSRDLHSARVRDLAARKRLHGLIDNIPEERIIKRPPNWLTIIVILFVGVGIVAYGNYSGQIYVWEAGLTLYQGYIVVGALLLVAFLLLVRYGVRRRRAR